jgi:uncharacterized protein
MTKRFLPAATLLLFTTYHTNAQSLQSFKVVSLKEVKPAGWLKKQIVRDMNVGYFSAIEEMQPTLQHAVFGPNKVTNFRIDKNGDYTIQKATWWWGEHEAFWADAIIRSAYLTGDKKLMKKADSIANYVMTNQEKDGYIGIYKEGNRLDKLKGENGELWAQSKILGALLGYYEFTGKKPVLDAVEKAAQYTMSHYGEGKASYFQAKNKGGGTSHGLMFVETMEMLYRLTGKKQYADFGIWLYNDYSTSSITINKDNQLDKLLDKDLLFHEHGAHVADHNRVVFWMAELTKDPKFKQAFDNIFYKLNKSSVPSGALVSDEMVEKREGDPALYYEYCTMLERVISTFSGIQKSGRAALADEIESIVFNAAQGARFADLTATSYCSRDNKIEAVPTDKNFRFQYSANNSPLCCNLNAAKLYPYYVSNLWMKTTDNKGVVATAYGPSVLTTSVKGTKVVIDEVTNYPFENQVTFKITTAKPATFAIICRKPGWAKNVKVNAAGAKYELKDGYYIITKSWKTGDQVSLTFDAEVETLQAVNGDSYIKKGVLIYSLPVKENLDTVTTFKNRFYTFDIVPQDRPAAEKMFRDYKLVVDKTSAANFKVVMNPAAKKDYPWDVPYYFMTAKFEVDGQVKTEKLYPMGSTILRKVTFPSITKVETAAK